MGFWGSLVLCRPTRGSIEYVAAIALRDGSIEEIDRPGGLWQVGRCDGNLLLDDADDFLAELVAETGAPALVGYVLDSDAVELVAGGGASGLWRSCLNRSGLEAYDEVEDDILLPGPAVERMQRWAAEAALSPDLAAVVTVFEYDAEDGPNDADDDAVVFKKRLFYDLVEALGTGQASSEPVPAPTAAPAKRARSKNPLDAFISDYMAEPLRAAGYTRKGRHFRRHNDRDDYARINPTVFSLGYLLNFHVAMTIAPRPYVALLAQRLGRPVPDPPGMGDDIWVGLLMPPPRPGFDPLNDLWVADGEQQRDDLGRQLVQALLTKAVPTLDAMLHRTNLIDAIRFLSLVDQGLRGSGAADAAQLLAEDGPSVLLDQVLTDVDWPDVLELVHRELAERGYPDDTWRERVDDEPADPVVRVRALLAGRVDDTMAGLGFARSGTRYSRTSQDNAFTVVDVEAQSHVGDDVRFRVSSNVVPVADLHRPTADWYERWELTWRRPPPAHAACPGADLELLAGLWTFTDDTAAACGAALAAVLAELVSER